MRLAEICRNTSISQATYFTWKKEDGRPASERDVPGAEAARRRARKLRIADLSLDKEMLQDALRRNL